MKQGSIAETNCPATDRVVVGGNEFGPHRRARPLKAPARKPRPPGTAAAEKIRKAKAAIAQKIERAGRTLRHLPGAPTPGGGGGSWPAVLREFADLVGNETLLNAKTVVRPAGPSPAAIDEADQVLVWLLWLGLDQRRVVWGKMLDLGFRKIERKTGFSRTKSARLWHSSINLILQRISTK